MQCKEIRAAISDYIDGEVTAEIRRSIKGHLDQCTACREYYQTMNRIAVNPLKELPAITAPETIWNKIQEKIEPLKPAETGFDLDRLKQAIGWFFPKPAMGLASLVGVILFVSVFLIQPRPINEAEVYLAEQLLFLGGVSSEALETADDDAMGANLEGFLLS